MHSRRSISFFKIGQRFVYLAGRVFFYLLWVLCLLIIFSIRPEAQGPEWVEIGNDLRVTYYGPAHGLGDLTASSIPYSPSASRLVALGPYWANVVRDYYGLSTPGGPLRWWRMPDGAIWYTGIGGCYPVMVTWNSARWWGCRVQLCVEDICREYRMLDTGSKRLDADLPDEPWLDWGYPQSQGVFTATLRVMAW